MPDGLKAVIFRFDISIFLWYLYKMVAQNILRTFEEKEVCSETNFGFDGSFDVTKYLNYSICAHRVESYHLI